MGTIQRTQIYANGKYLVDSHVLTAMGRFHDMLLVVVGLGQQRAELRDPSNLQFINIGLAMSLILLINDSAKPF